MNIIHYRDGNTARFEDEPQVDSQNRLVRVSGEEISFDELKAIFFVEPGDEEDVDPNQRLSLMAVEFQDGEVIRGRAHYNPASPGFLLFPQDSERSHRI